MLSPFLSYSNCPSTVLSVGLFSVGFSWGFSLGPKKNEVDVLACQLLKGLERFLVGFSSENKDPM